MRKLLKCGGPGMRYEQLAITIATTTKQKKLFFMEVKGHWRSPEGKV